MTFSLVFQTNGQKVRKSILKHIASYSAFLTEVGLSVPVFLLSG